MGGWLRLRLLAADLLPFVVSDLSQGSAYGRVNSLMYHFALLSPVNDALLHAKCAGALFLGALMTSREARADCQSDPQTS